MRHSLHGYGKPFDSHGNIYVPFDGGAILLTHAIERLNDQIRVLAGLASDATDTLQNDLIRQVRTLEAHAVNQTPSASKGE